MSAILPEDVMKLCFAECNLRLAALYAVTNDFCLIYPRNPLSPCSASMTCKHYQELVWKCITTITGDFFVSDSAEGSESQTRRPQKRKRNTKQAQEYFAKIIPKLVNVTCLDLSSTFEFKEVPESRVFRPLLPRLRVYKVEDLEDVEELDALDPNIVETLEATVTEFADWDWPPGLEDAIITKQWPKLKHLRLSVSEILLFLNGLMNNAPNLETLVIEFEDEYFGIDEDEGIDPTSFPRYFPEDVAKHLFDFDRYAEHPRGPDEKNLFLVGCHHSRPRPNGRDAATVSGRLGAARGL